MTASPDFYRTLGVTADVGTDGVRKQARERLDEFRDQIETAADPVAMERRLILAFEVLTDPKERYLYELFGHERYLDERYEGGDLPGDARLDADLGITPVFCGEGGGGETEIFDPTAGATETEIFDGSADESAVGGARRGRGGEPTHPDSAVGDTGLSDAGSAATPDGAEASGPTPDAPRRRFDEISTRETLGDRLSAYPLRSSPLMDLPGMAHEQHRTFVAGGYALCVLLALLIGGTVLPYGSMSLGSTAVGAFLVGSLGTYILGSLYVRRDLTRRVWAGSLLVLPVVVLPDLGVAPMTSSAVLAVGGLACGLAGVAAGNAYIDATRQRLRAARNRGGGRGGETYTETAPTAGTLDTTIDGEAILERLIENKAGGTTRPAEDLLEQATFLATRRLVPERHIDRRLEVEDTREREEVSDSAFAAIRAQLREDVADRDQNHPYGFTERTDTYLLPDTVSEADCPNCSGQTTVPCGTCSGHGQVTCGACAGNARVQCRRCGGNGRVSSGGGYADCGGCGATGYTPCPQCSATGAVTCGTCHGDGLVQCDRCAGDGRVVQFMTLTRTYEPTTQVEYVTDSLPTAYLESPAGVQVEMDRTRNQTVNAVGGDVFMRETEVRELPTDVVTYEYAGDLWEAYKLDDGVTCPTYPYELGTRVRALVGASVLLLGAFVFAGVFGPTILP